MVKQIRALLVAPQQLPEEILVDDTREDFQLAVGGNIELARPFYDEVGLIVNGAWRYFPLPPNRRLKSTSGQVYDLLTGTFLVVGLDGEEFCSLSDEMVDKYKKWFGNVEYFD